MEGSKKPGLSLVIGMGGDKPKGDEMSAPGGDSRAMCGKALLAAIKRGDGAGIMDALEECVSMIDEGDLEETEELPEGEEDLEY